MGRKGHILAVVLASILLSAGPERASGADVRGAQKKKNAAYGKFYSAMRKNPNANPEVLERQILGPARKNFTNTVIQQNNETAARVIDSATRESKAYQQTPKGKQIEGVRNAQKNGQIKPEEARRRIAAIKKTGKDPMGGAGLGPEGGASGSGKGNARERKEKAPAEALDGSRLEKEIDFGKKKKKPPSGGIHGQ